MSNLREKPPQEYWEELRVHSAKITQRERELTPVVYPGVIAVDAWSSGEWDFDTTGFIAMTAEPFFRKHHEVISLTAFNSGAGGKDSPRMAVLYELDLTPGKESAIALPAAGLKLTRFGIARRAVADERALDERKKATQKFGGKRVNFMQPSEKERKFIRQQLIIGAAGGYSFPK